MSNIYDTANQLEREIRELKEFSELQAAFEGMKADEEAHALFHEFQTLQMTLQQKQMQGEEFTEEDTKQAQEVAEKVKENQLINDLMMKEQTFSGIVNDLNNIIMGPVRDLYQH